MAQHGQESDFEAEYQYHRREWMAQRVGWITMMLILAAALLGLFGRGPMSHVEADGQQFRLSYERFVRYNAPTELSVQATGATQRGLEIHLAHTFIDAYKIEAITPEPSHMSSTGDAVMFRFDTAGPATRVTFRLEPDEIGLHTGTVRMGSNDGLLVSQFIYP